MLNRKSEIVARILAGSRLYGTNGPTSDYDEKIVFAHSLDALIEGAKDCDRAKDAAINTEYEYFSVMKFASLLIQNQTGVVEMLFAPESNVIQTSPAWKELQENRHRIVSKHILPFVAYCKNQAHIYSNKGNRLTFLEDLLDLVNVFKTRYDCDTGEGFIEFISNTYPEFTQKHIECNYLAFIDSKAGDRNIQVLEFLGKCVEETAPISIWIERITNAISKYGDRARVAGKNMYDLKASYHAYRIASEAIELLEYGNLTFPRPEVDTLLAIRDGKVKYDVFCASLQELIAGIDSLVTTSNLPDKPDNHYISRWAMKTQRNYIEKEIHNDFLYFG